MGHVPHTPAARVLLHMAAKASATYMVVAAAGKQEADTEILPGLACHFQHILFYLVKQVARPARIPGVGKKPTSDGRSCRELAALCSILSIPPFATVVSIVPPSRGHAPNPRPLHLSPPRRALPTPGVLLVGVHLSRAQTACMLGPWMLGPA